MALKIRRSEGHSGRSICENQWEVTQTIKCGTAMCGGQFLTDPKRRHFARAKLMEILKMKSTRDVNLISMDGGF